MRNAFRAGDVADIVPAAPARDWSSPVRIRRSGDAFDIIAISFDANACLIRAFAAGAWSVDETERYIAALTALAAGSRSAFGKARVLLDRRKVSLQSPEVAELLAAANGAIFEPDDKIALVVASSVMKVSLRQRMPHPGSKAFLSIDAAETWLRAFGDWR